jgi:hypothetical protein
LGAYAPSENLEELPMFYQELQTVTDTINKNDYIILMGYLNSQVSSVPIPNFIGENGKTVCNKNGKYIKNFCKSNDFRITNTHFKHKDIHTSSQHMLRKHSFDTIVEFSPVT